MGGAAVIAAFDMGPQHGNAEHVGAVVAAIGDEDRRPGVACHRASLDQPLVGVHRGAADRNDRGGVLPHPAQKLIGTLGETAATLVAGVAGNVLAGLDVFKLRIGMYPHGKTFSQ